MKESKNYGFYLDNDDDFYDVGKQSENWEKADGALKELSNAQNGKIQLEKDGEREGRNIVFKVTSQCLAGGEAGSIKVSPSMGIKII